MKIGVISDTHCMCDPRVVEYFRDVDEIWHAGDIGDGATLQWLQGICPVVRAVSGNIDGGIVRRLCPERLTFTTGGAKVMMTHIGGYPGHYAPGVRTALLAERPDIFVAGHSHILRVIFDRSLNVLYINPGAAGNQGWQKVRTLVRFELNDGKPSDLEVIELGPRGYRS
ncbi:MAG: metallophosphatase family protein [Bacteroidales bacterium]|nr:metallophosphatase family protein [Bacteroidales bacterium]